MQVPPLPINGTPLPSFGLLLLGNFELKGPDGVVDLPSKKLAGLLAYLACTAPRPQPREKLSALLWGSHFDAQAKQNLRQALSRLRKVLGPDILESDGEVVSLNATVVSCDVSRFEALVREGSREALSAAVDLYRGRPIDDVTIDEEGWNDWLTGERDRLLELALGAMTGLGEQELAAGRPEHALKAGQRAIALNNLREDAHRLVVQALAATGRKAEALKHYQNLVKLLRRELSTEPDAATRSLVAGLRSTEPGRSAVAKIALRRPDRPPVAALPVGHMRKEHKQANADNPAPDSDVAVSAVAVHSGSAEQRQLTIMVCNIAGSMALAACHDPEDMHDLVAVFHKVVAGVVSRFDGFVAQYLSAGVHVYFGYPAAREHDPEQAVRAAFAILDAVGALEAPFDVTLQASLGIATGLVVVGERPGIGDTLRIAIGEAPNVAAQLQSLASPGEVVIGAGTHRLVGRMFDCSALGANEVEGLPQPLEAWRVRGETGVSRFESRRSGALTPFIGRQEEIELLLRRWDQAKSGEGRVVLLSGEPGIGKSRIAESLLSAREGELHARFRYFCSPHHAQSPLYPFIAQLERVAGFDPGSDAGAKLDKLEVLLKPTTTNLPRDVVLIAELLGVPTDGRYPALAVSPQQKREMTLAAILDQLDGAAALGPVLIVLEDAHWIDPTSQDLFDRTVARVASLPVLLVVTARPELQPPWVGEPHVTMLPLSRLGRGDSAGIIAGVAKGKGLPDAVLEQILLRADGVPLFIEELTSTLLESGVLRETEDGYLLNGPLPALAVPTTLQASLVARLDRLASVKDVAQVGAAIGREFSHELIAAVSALAPMQLDAALERLTRSSLISRRGTPPEAIYSFKHALVQDAAYTTMLKSRRRQLHADIAKVLVGRFPAMAETQPALVAHHFTEAGLASEATGYWRKAGRLALARWALGEAAESFRQVLQVLEKLPESQFTLEEAFDTLLELRPALVQLGEPQQAMESLRKAETLSERLNDDRRRTWVSALMTNAHSNLGELDEALVTGTRALEIAKRLDDLKLRIPATSYLEQAHYYRGDYEQVVALSTNNLAVLPPDWVHENFGMTSPPSIWDRCYLMLSLGQLGQFAETAEPEAEAMPLAAATQQPFTIGLVHFVAGWTQVLRGNWAKAHPRIEQAISVWQAGNVAVMLPTSVACSAWVLAQLGEARKALSRLREGERLFERHSAGRYYSEFGILHCLGSAGLVLGRLNEAERLGERAVEMSSVRPGWRALALHLLGDIATHPDRFDAERGEAHYRQALALAEPRGMRPLVAHCHLGLGKVYLRTSQRDHARNHLTVATTMYRDMDMTYWLQQVEAKMLQPS